MGLRISTWAICFFHRVTGHYLLNLLHSQYEQKITFLTRAFLTCTVILFQFSSEEKAKEAEEFFASRVTPSISRTLKQSIERVGINTKWVQSIKSEGSLAAVVKELAYRRY